MKLLIINEMHSHVLSVSLHDALVSKADSISRPLYADTYGLKPMSKTDINNRDGFLIKIYLKKRLKVEMSIRTKPTSLHQIYNRFMRYSEVILKRGIWNFDFRHFFCHIATKS